MVLETTNQTLGVEYEIISEPYFNPWSAHCFLKFLKKTQAILLYWFVAQQQTSTSRRQKFTFFYLKFSAKFNEVSFKF